MGWWGDRAKDGDHPLDLLGRWEDSGKSAKAFVKAELKAIDKDEEDGYYRTSWVGLVTLLCERGETFDKAIYEQALKWSDNKQDQMFFKGMVSDGKPMMKKKFLVTFVVEAEGMDEKLAVEEACKTAERASWNRFRVKELLVDGKPYGKPYQE